MTSPTDGQAAVTGGIDHLARDGALPTFAQVTKGREGSTIAVAQSAHMPRQVVAPTSPAQQGAAKRAQRVVAVDELAALTGQRLGVSRWHTVSQREILAFAHATGDHQWIHVDPVRAAAGPFGTTIAHGYLILSLAPVLLWDVLEVTGAAQVVNYGIDRLRFPAPVPAGSRVRLAVDLTAVTEVKGGVQAALGLTFELESSTKPACVAGILFRYYA